MRIRTPASRRIRRHKSDPEVSAEVGNAWAERRPPEPVEVAASPAENAVFAELADTWLFPEGRQAPTSGEGRSLFPWTLFKAFLLSHVALLATVEERCKRLARKTAEHGRGATEAEAAEDEALERLAALAEAADADASKRDRLVDLLGTIGVGKGSDMRAVVFSERIATLDWLARTVPERLGLEPDRVRVLHGGLADTRQLELIEEFALADSPVRLLLTGDMASEGVNLHSQCHQLVHFDLPWSLIRIQQRNGRIDRYGQRIAPEIRSLVLVPDHPTLSGDVRVVTSLLEKEHEAHLALGEAAPIMGLNSVELEEDAVMKALRDRRDLGEVVPDEPKAGFDIEQILKGGAKAKPVEVAPRRTLFADDRGFVLAALAEAFADPDAELDMRHEPEHDLISFVPPADLLRRLRVLPQSYLNEQGIAERMRLTFDRHVAETELRRAREGTDSNWPTVGFVSELHPVTEWLVDKLLAGVGRNEVQVVTVPTDDPVWLVLGVYSNERGQAQIVEWMAVTDSGDGMQVGDMLDVLSTFGVDADLVNPRASVDVRRLEDRLPAVVDTARAHMAEVRLRRGEMLRDRIRAQERRWKAWEQSTRKLVLDLPKAFRAPHERRMEQISESTERLLRSMRTSGEPLVRVLGVLTGAD